MEKNRKVNNNKNKNEKNGTSIFTDYRLYLGINTVLLLVIIFLLVRGNGSGANVPPAAEPQNKVSAEGDPAQDVAAPEGEAEEGQEAEAPEEPANELKENTHGSIDQLVQRYCSYIAEGDVDSLEDIVDVVPDEEKDRIRSRAAFIESFDNVVCYTKKGPVEDSYIVFVCYDMKLINIETSAPDIICLYVSPNGDDGRRIHYGNIDEDMQEYVTELEKDPEVQALYEDVRTRYQAAQEEDDTLAAFVQRLQGAGEEPEEPAEEEQPPEGSEEAAEEQPSGVTAQNRETHVTDTVNVRADTSTESEKLTLAYAGDAITQIESYDNGWSKVEYKGITGYVKTEFIE